MQLMIDTAADPTDLLRRAAAFLVTEADARDAEDHGPTLPIRPNTLRIPELAAAGETAPVVDTAAIFSANKQPAGLDGHGPNPVPLPLVAPKPPVAPAPPAAAAPVGDAAASAGTAQPAANPVERDSSGLPYDARIHQAARGKKRDGTWKNQKGIDPAVVASVTAELRSASPAPAAPVTSIAPPPPAASAPVAPPPPADTANTGQPAALSPGAPSGVTAFRVLMQTITANTNTGKLNNDEVDAALKSVGLPPRQLISLVQNPDKVQGVADYIAAVLATKG